MLCAIAEDKPIQLVLEEEQRFHPFNLERWMADSHKEERSVTDQYGRTIVRSNAEGIEEPVLVPPAICSMIDDKLPDAIPYRRRDYEAEAFTRELCRRNGLVLPPKEQQASKSVTPLSTLSAEQQAIAAALLAESVSTQAICRCVC